MRWYFIVVLICISLMIRDAEHLFIYLLAICIFFGKMSIQVFCPLLIRLLVFFLLSHMSFLSILDINPLSDMYGLQTFSPVLQGASSFCGLYLLLYGSFSVWCSPTCLFLLMLLVFLVSYPKNHCQDQCGGAFSICFVLGVLWFQVLHLSL